MCVKSLFLCLNASEERQGEKVPADDGKGARGKFSQPFLPLMNWFVLKIFTFSVVMSWILNPLLYYSPHFHDFVLVCK